MMLVMILISCSISWSRGWSRELLTQRTRQFALRIIKLCQFLDSQSNITRTIAQQLLRSGTSIGANIEESQAAESTADFIHKLSISLKETRETRYWLLLLSESELVKNSRLQPLLHEIEQLIKIIKLIGI